MTRCLGLCVLLLTLGASSASACWDGYRAVHGNIEVMGGDTEWTPQNARDLALWLPRLQAVLGEDGEGMQVFWGEAELATGTTIEFPDDRLDILFDRLAHTYGLSPRARRAAMNAGAPALTIQLAATRDKERAESMVRSLTEWTPDADEDQLILDHGFYEAGGFPADNPAVHILERIDEQSGETVYQVVAGAFIDRSAAEATLARLTQHLPYQGFVRRL